MLAIARIFDFFKKKILKCDMLMEEKNNLTNSGKAEKNKERKREKEKISFHAVLVVALETKDNPKQYGV